ncbi:MAG TPA: patatin family protein [Firmicutes bacterium]|jgi:NTE family protein|nr:patatin family protein [Bacillota bacterium]
MVFNQRVATLKSTLKRPLVGLALGSGAARGLSHIGVLQVLKSEGIPIDAITGTSIGAVVGGLYLAGWSPEFLDKFAKAIRKQHIVSALDFALPPKKGLIDGYHLEAMLNRMLKIKRYEDLPKPFATISSDIVTGEKVVHDKGDLVKGIRASLSVPGVLVPQRYETRLLVDGGVVDPVPVDTLSESGIDIIIAINVMRRPSPGKEPEGIIDVLLNVTDIMGFKIFEEKPLEKAIVIEPLKEYHFGGMEFDKAEELIELGKEATKRALPLIKERLSAEGVILCSQ